MIKLKKNHKHESSNYNKQNIYLHRKKRLHLKQCIITTIISILSITLLFSGYKIVRWIIDSKNTKKITTKIENKNIKIAKDDKNTELVNKSENLEKSNPYWDYIKMDLLSVDFSKLNKTNNETVGWIYVGGTNINYPVVQTSNNLYYLTHSFDKSYNTAGWVFMDYRNNPEIDQNTIIYAHGRYDKTMFGTLKNIGTNGWLKNKNNYIIKFSTEKENTLWQIFSFYIIDNTNDYLYTNFNNDNDYLNFLNKIKNRSAYNFNTTVNTKDKIITLSTCYNDYKKVVMHAKLIKKQTK